MRRWWWVLVAAGALAIDQGTKHWARTALRALPDGVMALWPGVIGLRYAENTGAAFGLLSGVPWLLFAVAGVMSAVIWVVLVRWRAAPPALQACLALMAAGGLGNLIDRVLYGHVIDFLEFQFVRFAIFNAADSWVTLGAAGLLIYILVSKGEVHEHVVR